MNLPKRFKDELTKFLEEEELDLYVLSMHYLNDGDLNYFRVSDRRRVRSIFDVLIQDTQRHAELLKNILETSEK